MARHGRRGWAGRGTAWRGEAWQARLGTARLGLAWQAWRGAARHGEAGRGMAGEAGLGEAWLGLAGMARHGRHGTAWRGMARHGVAGMARLGSARRGTAGIAQTAAIERGISGSQTTKKMKLIKEENDIESKNDEIKKQLEAIANRPAGLNPRTLLTEAANPLSCLHKYFEWDDTEAALKWREAQAYDLIRRIKVEIITPENRTLTVRAFWPIKHLEPDGTIDSGKRGSFILFNNIMDDAEATRQVIANAKSELIAFHTKYSKLAELLEFGALFDEIKKLNSK